MKDSSFVTQVFKNRCSRSASAVEPDVNSSRETYMPEEMPTDERESLEPFTLIERLLKELQ